MEHVDQYLQEFLERMNRPASFADRKVGRHLSEIFISWMDLILVAIKINNQKKLYNATEEEYKAFLEACDVSDCPRAKTLPALIRFWESNKLKRHAKIFDLSFHQQKWDEIETTHLTLSKGSRMRLCGYEKQKKAKPRELFFYVDFTHKPGIWIELYGTGKLLSSHYSQLVAYCDKVGAFLSGQEVQINVSDFHVHHVRDELRDSLQLDEMLKIQQRTDPKILLPYVERSMSQMIQIIQRSFEEHSGSKIDFLDLANPASPNQRAILPEFVFSILIARGVVETESALIPDKLGYLLTDSQINAIRNYLKTHKNRVVNEIHRAPTDSNLSTLQSLIGSTDGINPEKWIDLLHELVLVHVDSHGNPVGSSYGVSSYVVKVQQTEYITHLARDSRIGKETNYPVDVRFIEDQFIHGEFLLMIPIFMGGKVAAIFWVTSNIPITPEIRFPIISTVRKYEYLISNAIMMEWRVVRRFVGEKEQKILGDWLNALEDLAIHPLTRVKDKLALTSDAATNGHRSTDEVDFVIEVIRFLARHDQEPDKSYAISILDTISNIVNKSPMRKHVKVDILVDPGTIYSNEILFTEALRNIVENSYREAYNSPDRYIRINSKVLLDENALLLAIWDSGAKFPLSVQQDVFQRPVVSTHGGKGVGLHLTKLIIEKLGGAISIDSDQKTINVKLPLT